MTNEINAHAAASGVATDATANATPAGATSHCCGDCLDCAVDGSGPVSEAAASVTKKSCGECHWWRNGRFEYHANGIAGNCITPMADSLMSIGTMRGDEGSHCPAFRQRGERLPQRFKVWLSGGWTGGICWPMNNGRWALNILTMHGTFSDDPREMLAEFIGDAEVVWIDNDFGWSGK